MANNQLEKAYNPRVAVPDHECYRQARVELSTAFRARTPGQLDLRYGEGERMLMDIFVPDPRDRPAPLVVFFHGGYWRAGDKREMSMIAEPLLEAGVAVAIPGYDLCPTVRLPTIIDQARAAVAHLVRHGAAMGIEPHRLVVSGVSAGAHLAAACLAHDWNREELPGDLIRGALPITGIYDPAVVLRLSVNEEIQLREEDLPLADMLSIPCLARCPVTVAVGGEEPDAWIAQSRDYCNKLHREGLDPVDFREIPGENHFSIAQRLAEADHPLTGRLIELAHNA